MENLNVLALIKNLYHALEEGVSSMINGVNGQIGQYVVMIVKGLGLDNAQMEAPTVKVQE